MKTTEKISYSIKKDLLEIIDKKRKLVSRSAFLNKLVEMGLKGGKLK